MKSLFFSYLSKFNRLIAFCIVGVSVSAFSGFAIANPIRDLQDEVAKRGISPEEEVTLLTRLQNRRIFYCWLQLILVFDQIFLLTIEGDFLSQPLNYRLVRLSVSCS